MSKEIPAETQREAILGAAAVCFAELGFESSSLADIAARCGLEESIVSEHYASKADIRTALLALWSERLSAWISNA